MGKDGWWGKKGDWKGQARRAHGGGTEASHPESQGAWARSPCAPASSICLRRFFSFP